MRREVERVLKQATRDLLDLRQRVTEIRIVDPRGFRSLVVRPG